MLWPMKRHFHVPFLSVALALLGASPAMAYNAGHCEADAAKHCLGMHGQGTQALDRCLQENKEKLSERCRKSISDKKTPAPKK